MTNLNVLTCKNPECKWTIPLPPPTHPDISRYQPWWPMDGLPRNFQCYLCKHVFEYKGSEVHPVSAGYMDQDLVRKCNNVVCVKLSCGITGCVTPPQIRI